MIYYAQKDDQYHIFSGDDNTLAIHTDADLKTGDIVITHNQRQFPVARINSSQSISYEGKTFYEINFK